LWYFTRRRFIEHRSGLWIKIPFLEYALGHFMVAAGTIVRLAIDVGYRLSVAADLDEFRLLISIGQPI
jgi:hypothetical protein